MSFLSNLTTFAAETAGSTQESDILTSLGIDWKLLVLQLVAFLILVWALSKWVYPIFFRIIDEREKKIIQATEAAAEAEKKAEQAEAKVEDALKVARTEATDIVATAKAEATAMIEKAENDAKKRSDRIVSEAHESLEKDVIAARATLKKDTLQLVKEAAELATAHVADDKLDSAIIKKSLEGAKK